MVLHPTSRQVIGATAESAVADYLTRLGYLVLQRNVRVGHYEIDVVARDGRVLVIIEVRFRGPGALTSGFGSLSATKRNRVRRAGERLWHSHYRLDPTIDHMRFDAASVHFDTEGNAHIEYAKAAF